MLDNSFENLVSYHSDRIVRSIFSIIHRASEDFFSFEFYDDTELVPFFVFGDLE